MAGPPKKKQVREVKTTTETVIAAAINSPYNTLTPMHGAKNVRVSDPISRLDKMFSTEGDAFAAYLVELCNLGMKERIIRELDSFSKNIDPAWGDIRDKFLQSLETGTI